MFRLKGWVRHYQGMTHDEVRREVRRLSRGPGIHERDEKLAYLTGAGAQDHCWARTTTRPKREAQPPAQWRSCTGRVVNW